MKSKILFLFAITTGLQAGYDFAYYKPTDLDSYPNIKSELSKISGSKKESLQDKKVLITELKAIIFAPEGESPPEYIRASSKGVEFYRISFNESRKKEQEFQAKINKLAIGKPLTFEILEKIKKEIITFYKDSGKGLVAVSAQEDDVRDGVVVLSILESRLGQVSVKGNKWFSPEVYTEFISIEPDEIIVDSKVKQDIAWANRSPYRKVDVIYKSGKTYGTTDIELNIQDQLPFQVSSGVENTGFDVTGTGRFFMELNWGNVLDMDQMLTFQYSSSLNLSSFQEVLLKYTAPLPWRDLLVFHGGYSKVQSSDNFLSKNLQEGESWQFTSRYAYPFSKGAFRQEGDIGFDYKATNNNLIVGEDLISPQIATLLELAATYQLGFTYSRHSFDANAEAYLQPWSIGESMSQFTYDLLRPDASPYYSFFKLGAEYRWLHESGAMIKILAKGQISSAPLLPIEQFGVGGENSVRGYPERALNSDEGFILNFDLFSPKAKLIQSIKKNKRIQDAIQGVFFFDVGFASLLDPSSTESKSHILAGMGPGFRYQASSWLYMKFDYGFRLADLMFNSKSSTLGHPYFSVIAAY
jgi:hemolysin activation/secretion protein